MVLHLFCNQATAVRFCHGAPQFIGESSNGRTPDFDSGSCGSSPCSPAILTCKYTMNNIADLTTVELDEPRELIAQWDKQWLVICNRKLEARNYVEQDDLTVYFQGLFNSILSAINLPHQCFIIQHHDYEKNNNKMSYVSQMHSDTERKCCITIPVFSQEPICFYNDVAVNNSTPRELGKYKKPTRTYRYSRVHPSLVNVQNTHNVFIADITLPRVLLQISYDFTFDEIVNSNPGIFNVYD